MPFSATLVEGQVSYIGYSIAARLMWCVPLRSSNYVYSLSDRGYGSIYTAAIICDYFENGSPLKITEQTITHGTALPNLP